MADLRSCKTIKLLNFHRVSKKLSTLSKDPRGMGIVSELRAAAAIKKPNAILDPVVQSDMHRPACKPLVSDIETIDFHSIVVDNDDDEI